MMYIWDYQYLFSISLSKPTNYYTHTMSLQQMIGMLQAGKCGTLSGDALNMCNANFTHVGTKIGGMMKTYKLSQTDVESGLKACIPCMTEEGMKAGMCSTIPFPEREDLAGMDCDQFRMAVFGRM